jgi:GNAT superfamily N-acetyltransferase
LLAPASGCALVVEAPGAFADRVVAVANLVGEGVQAELALLVEDAWQRRGIGTALLRRAASIAADTGFEALVIHTQAQNGAMRRALRRLDGDRQTETDAGVLTVTLRVAGTGVRAGSR